MPRTNAQIDALNAMREPGEPFLPYEEGDTGLTAEQIAENEKIAADKKAQEEKDLAEKEKAEKEKQDDEAEKLKIAAQADADKLKLEQEEKERIEKEEKEKAEKTKIEEPELDDEKILAYLKAKKGKELSSLDELLNPKPALTEEEKQQLAEKREADKLAYGLSKGLFTNKQFEEYITDTKNPKDLVFAAYAAEQKANDDTLTDEEIQTEFNERFGLDEDKESRRYKSGQALISNIAKNIISQKHSKILGLENVYSAFEKEQEENNQKTATFQSKAPIYKKDIQEVGSDLKKIVIPISDTENFEYPLDETTVNDVISDMLDDGYSQKQITNGWEKENMRQLAQTSIIIKNLPKILKQYADDKVKAAQAGLRGIPPKQKEGERVFNNENLTENQKKALGMIDEIIAN